MSQENVEIVRRACAALTAGDIDRLVTLCHEAFDLDMSDRVFNPTRYRGHDGMRRFYVEVHEPWEHYVWDVQELQDRGDVIVALVRARGRGRGSGLEVDREAAMIWTVRAGKASGLCGSFASAKPLWRPRRCGNRRCRRRRCGSLSPSPRKR